MLVSSNVKAVRGPGATSAGVHPATCEDLRHVILDICTNLDGGDNTVSLPRSYSVVLLSIGKQLITNHSNMTLQIFYFYLFNRFLFHSFL